MKRANRIHHIRAPKKGRVIKLPLGMLAYFIWVVPAMLLPQALARIGAPYLLITYEYQNRGGERFYVACTYAGAAGVRSIRPVDGACPFVKMMAAAT